MALVFAHPAFGGHVTPPGHPERVDRLRAVEAGLQGLALTRSEAPMALLDAVTRCHPRAYADRVAGAVPREGWAQLDGDTYLSPGSLEAALRAVGGAGAAVDAVLGGVHTTAFVACRPPGHHAETATAMGFCLFGTVAIAAKRALDHHGLSRVAIVDFDVHHGNGTQAAFWDDPMLFFASSHQSPLYPGSGERHERGVANNIANTPLAPGSGSREFRHAWERDLLPAIEAFAPDLLIVSAGFDAHAADPLAQMRLEAADYAWLTGELVALAGRHCGGKIVSSLEGGYDLAALAESVVAHVKALDRPAD